MVSYNSTAIFQPLSWQDYGSSCGNIILPPTRPKGRKSAHLKLDTKEAEIRSYLNKGISKRSIAKLVDCSPSTLYDWLERKHLHSRHKVGSVS